ncbi:uroporphyrinogen decarboxylase family protein [Syntrophomonas wolfei]|uniref:uroporphyrinogen decarboxylase family protein n=1 Tax=Syntrophomonas wolfei TaxID=863 RepID=UPI0023F1222D|nr:uroporphyrinogen decarboxylase family protein [Syntrophomonas wolfei]
MSISGINFVCAGRDELEIPREIVEQGGFYFPDLHNDSQEMARLALAIKLNKQNSICMLPFCLTVEAEALGARVNLGNADSGPRISSYSYESIEQLKELEMVDFNSGRIKSVLDAVETLTQSGEVVALNVSGPFTLITSLLDPMVFYKAIKKNRERIDDVLRIIEENILRYILKAIKRGVKIISYADAVGTADMVGPRIYKDIAGITSLNLLKRLQTSNELDGCMVHICGKTSVSLEKHGFVKSFPIEVSSNQTYGQAIAELLNKSEGSRFIGHNCMKRTVNRLKDNTVWGIKF